MKLYKSILIIAIVLVAGFSMPARSWSGGVLIVGSSNIVSGDIAPLFPLPDGKVMYLTDLLAGFSKISYADGSLLVLDIASGAAYQYEDSTLLPLDQLVGASVASSLRILLAKSGRMVLLQNDLASSNLPGVMTSLDELYVFDPAAGVFSPYGEHAGSSGCTSEVCNGKDDDCDGLIDEGLTQPTTCGTGECARTGIETCSAGVWGSNTCSPGTPVAEVCDSKDNNCDGTVDNGPDSDSDGVNDVCDNCRLVSNPDQKDDNLANDDNTVKAGVQHYGDVCDPDFDNDGLVTLTDYAEWRKWYRQAVPPAPAYVDLDNDNLVGLSDYAVWRKYYRSVPGPGVE